jgi:hypothetical protein
MKPDKLAFVAAMNQLCAGYRAEPTEALLEFYWEALSDKSPSDLAAAVKRAARECERMPSAAELRRLCPKPESRFLPGSNIPTVAETNRMLEERATCSRHREDPEAPITPNEFVSWCRKCQRFRSGMLAEARRAGLLPAHGDDDAPTVQARPAQDEPRMTADERAAFDAFWCEYPRKDRKDLAMRAWVETAEARPPLQRLLEDLGRAKNTDAWAAAGGALVPFAANWLRGKRWLLRKDSEGRA